MTQHLELDSPHDAPLAAETTDSYSPAGGDWLADASGSIADVLAAVAAEPFRPSRRFLSSIADDEDARQIALVELWLALPTGRVQNPSAYYRLAFTCRRRDLARVECRFQRRLRAGQLIPTDRAPRADEPEEALISRETCEVISEARGSLPPTDRDLIDALLSGKTRQEMAVARGVTLPVLDGLIARARRRLEARLAVRQIL